MASYEDLVVWQKAHALAISVYGLAKHLPPDERYAIWDQLRRAAVSVPANIAEGSGTGSDGLMSRHLAIAGGSLAEVRYLLLLARDLGYLPADTYQSAAELASEVSRILTSFCKRVEERVAKPSRKG